MDQMTANELVDRGWTGGAIIRFLLNDNNKNEVVPTYDRKTVESIERTDEWKRLCRFMPRFEYPSLEFVDIEAEGRMLSVPVMSMEDLIQRACDSYNKFHCDVSFFIKATKYEDEAFLHRIAVNYIRHIIGEYDQIVRGATSYIDASSIVYEAIAKQYPLLAKECERQLERRRRRFK